MSVLRAYAEWRSARALLLQDDISNFSAEFDERLRAVHCALRTLSALTPATIAEAGMVLDAALAGHDLSEPNRQMALNVLALLKAQ